MKQRLLLLFSPLLSLVLFLGAPTLAHADTVTLSGSVKDSSGTAIGNATVTVNDSNNDTATTDPTTGQYSLSIPAGTYNVQVTPPTGSNFSSAIAYSESISTDTTLNFVLTNVGSYTIQGNITDENHVAMGGVSVELDGGQSNRQFTSTDANGHYSFNTVANTYNIIVVSGNNAIDIPSYSITQDTILNLNLPIRQVTVHVQDPNGVAQSGMDVGVLPSTGQNGTISGNVPVGGNTNNVSGSFQNSPHATTDSSGNVVFALLPTDSSHSYTFTVTPPSGSIYAKTTSTAQVTTDATDTIQLIKPFVLQGQITDENGLVMSGVSVELDGGQSNRQFTSTDANGHYSFNSLANSYNIIVTSGNNTVSFPYSVTQDATLNLTLPIRQVTVHVQDSSGITLSGMTVGVLPSTGQNGQISGSVPVGGNITNAGGFFQNSPHATTDSSGNVVFAMLPTDSSHSYTFTVTPPSGSIYAKTTSTAQITTDTTETIQLIKPFVLQGNITDENNVAMGGVSVELDGGQSNRQFTSTDANGHYTFNTLANSYNIIVSSGNNAVSFPYSVTQDATLNLTLPIRQVTVHVQDPNGVAVSGMNVGVLPSTGQNGQISGNVPVGGSITNASGFFQNSPHATTDSSGNVVFAMLPTDSSHSYKFTVTPPNGSIYAIFTLSNVQVSTDQTEVVALQYNHSTPVTTASLSPSPFSDGKYSDPTTVTLTASAAAVYTIANTYYTIDGGAQQTYSAPFIVSGAGSHTITYSSVDNSGVREATNTKTFTITESYNLIGNVYVDTNQNGVQDPGEQGYAGATVTLNTGQTATTDANGNYSFPNLEAGSYNEQLTDPNGYIDTTTNPVNVALAANTTQNFGIAQANTLVTAINAGGSTSGNFAADADFTGGTTYTSSSSVDTSGVINPAPQDVYQSVRYGNFSYTIPNLIPNGTYTVRLHFNELYWGTDGSNATGERVFNVSANGTQVLINYDIFNNALGANKAIVEQVPATADNNGNITLQFTSVTDNAMVSGIEVYTGTLPTPPPPSPVTSEAINAGGDVTGSFIADIDHFGGTTYAVNDSVDTSSVTNPAPQAVYQSERYGSNFTYIIPTGLSNTSYHVRLHFDENYWGTPNSGNQGGVGSRVFNVTLDGSQVLSNFDIYQTAGGADKAVTEDFDTTTDANGRITINFVSVTDNAMVNGIEISQN